VRYQKVPICENPVCGSFVPEDARGYKKKAEDSGDEKKPAAKKAPAKKPAAKKPAAKKSAAKKTGAKKGD
jgi:DNA topoisomerase-1